MKTNQNSLRLKLLLGTALVGLGGIASPAAAQLVGNNTDVRVPGGGSGLGPNPAILQIDNAVDATTLTVKAETVIAEWDQFDVPTDTVVTVTKDIGLGETTLLNRVIGVTESMILGEISSPDVNFWLINEGGIMFGADSIVSGKSLVFSTLNTTDADFFNFANNALVNGVTDTVRFQGTAGNTITALAGAQFVSDGSLWFVSEGLQLDADFDSANETVAFVTAQEAQVTFTPGSPLKIAVSEGSTLATADISGDIDGGFVAIVASREDMMSGLLSVNADITATGALPTEEGVMLIAGNTGADAVGVTFNGSITSSGLVDITASGDVTLTGDVTGTGIDIGGLGNDPAGAVQTAGLSGTTGVSVDATGSINAGAVAASNGDVILESVADVTTASITAQMGGVINVDSTGGGNLDLGDITSTGGGRVDFDTAGTLTLGDVDIESDLRIGRTNNPSALTLDGDITALSFVYETANAFVSQGITTTDGRIDIDAASIDTNGGNLNATNGRVDLVADGAISTGSITSTGTGSRIDVASEMGGDVTLGRLASEGNITLNTTGALITGSINDGAADDTTVGRLTIGAAAAPGTVTIGGNAAADSVTIESTGDIITEAVRSLLATGDVTLETTLGSIDARAITSERNANLSAGDSIAFTSVTAGNNADLEALTGLIGGTSVDAGNNAVLDAATLLIVSGAVEAGNLVTATSGDAMSLGSVLADEDSSGVGNVTLTTETAGAALAVTGSTQGVRVTVNSLGTASLGQVTSTNGAVNIDAVNDITTSTLSATGGNVEVTSTMGSITTGSITSDTNALLTADMGTLTSTGAVSAAGNIVASSDGDLTLASAAADTDDSGEGNVTLTTTSGDLTVNGATSGVKATINSGGAATLDSVITTAGLLDIDAVNDIVTGELTASLGDIRVTSTDGSITTGDATSDTSILFEADDDITTLVVDANNNATLNAGGSVDYTSVATNLNSTITAGMGDISGGDVTAGNNAMLTAGGMLEVGAVSADGNLTATAIGTLMLTSATADADGSGAGNLTLTSTDGPLEVTDASQGVRVAITSGGGATLGDVSSTGGLLNIEAENDITTANVSAAGGNAQLTSNTGDISTGDVTSDANDVLITAPGNITTQMVDAGLNATLTGADINYDSIAAGGDATLNATNDIDGGDVTAGIDAILTAGGMIDAGAITADRNIDVMATNSLTLFSASADNDGMDGGNLTLRSTNGDLTVTDASSGVSAIISSGGAATLGDVTTTGGLIDIDAVNAVTTGNLDATGGDVRVTSDTASIATGDVSSTANITLTADDSIDFTSVTADESATLTATTGDIAGGDLTAGGNATLTAAGNITTQMVDAGRNATLTAGGDIDYGSVAAGADATLGAGGAITGGSVTTGDLASLTAGTFVDVTDIDAGGNADLSAGSSIDFDSVDAGVNASLTAATSITGGPIDAGNDATLGAGTDIDVTDVTAGTNASLTAGGDIDYGSVAAGADATLGAGGAIEGGSVTTGDLASLTAATSISFTDIDAGGNADLNAGTSIAGGTVMAGGNAALDAGTSILVGDVTADADAALSAGTSLEAENVSAGDDLTATATGTLALTSAIADSDGSGAGNLELTSTDGPLTVADESRGVTVMIDSGGGATLGDVRSTGGLLTVVAENNISTGDVRATGGNAELTSNMGGIETGDVISDANKVLINAASGSITSEMVDAGTDATLTAGDDINYGSVDAGNNATLTAGGSINGGPVDAGNDATLTAGMMGSITSTDITAGNDATLTAGQAIGFTSVDAGDDAALTAGSSINGGPVVADDNARLNAGTSINIGDVTAGIDAVFVAGTTLATGDVNAGNNVDATSGDDMTLASAMADADVSGAGAVLLNSAAGPLAVVGAASGVRVNIESGGTVDLGSATATGGDVNIDADGTVTAGPTVASRSIFVNAGADMAPAANVTLTGNSSAGEAVDIDATGAVTLDTLDAGTSFTSTSADVNINGALMADNTVTLNVRDDGEAELGDQATDGFALTETEINRITVPDLIIDAGSGDITFSGLAFEANPGSSSVSIATTGNIDFTGSLRGRGAGRLFRFGGSPATSGSSLADNITLNIEDGEMDFEGADLELRANRILFGSTTFLSDNPVGPGTDPKDDPGNLRTADLLGDSDNKGDILNDIAGSSDSLLYQEQGLGSKEYLKADNLNVVYGEAALFQNSGEVSPDLVETTGAVIGETLTVNPIEGGINAFALFGTVAGKADSAPSIAGPTVVIQRTADEVFDPSSRINGCVIGTGAGCINTIIGLTAAEISPEQLDLLSAEEEVLLPFDPLVGTNNEGLFSDVEPECERDEEGACIQ